MEACFRPRWLRAISGCGDIYAIYQNVLPGPNSPDISDSLRRVTLWISGQLLCLERAKAASCIHKEKTQKSRYDIVSHFIDGLDYG